MWIECSQYKKTERQTQKSYLNLNLNKKKKMKLVIVLMAMVGISMACETKKTQEEFEDFRRRYRKNYESEDEYQKRCAIFAQNYEKVEEHNFRASRGLVSYTLGINKYADMTNEEFLQYYAGLKPELDSQNKDFVRISAKQTVPKAGENIDWRTSGHLPIIKNQARCGSCWAFATCAVSEALYSIKYNTPYSGLDLSEQMLIECSSGYGNMACNGGLMTNTYKYLIAKDHGFIPEHIHPYISGDGNNGSKTCDYDDKHSVVRITGYSEVPKNENDLISALKKGPVAVGINAGGDFQLYQSGVYCPGGALGLLTGCSALGINHAVLLVGVTDDYWIIQNSWGDFWGEGGFVKICRKYNCNCGICNLASYPHIA
jgi:C1A family cysteine protease